MSWAASSRRRPGTAAPRESLDHAGLSVWLHPAPQTGPWPVDRSGPEFCPHWYKLWSFDTVHRIAAGEHVAVQQVIEQAGQRGEFASQGGGAREATLLELVPPGQDVGARHRPKLFGRVQTDKAAEILDVALVRAQGARIVDIGERLSGCGYGGQVLKLSRCQSAFVAIWLERSLFIETSTDCVIPVFTPGEALVNHL